MNRSDHSQDNDSLRFAPVQYSAINLLSDGCTVPATASVLSLSPDSVYEWMRLPGFIATIGALRRRKLAAALQVH
jgi:hypothetical protein